MNALAIFQGPYALLARWAVIGLLALAIGTFGWVKGNEHGTRKLTEYQAKQAMEAVRIIKGRDTVTVQTLVRYVRVAAATKGVKETVEKEVTKYAEANPTLTLDARWRVLHDAAAANTVPPSSGGTDAAGGAPTAAAALATVTKNYAACNRTSDRLDGLQQWVRAQEALR